MSLLITFNGSNFIIPTTNEVGWGSNLDAYLVAIAAGSLQKTGGLFTLSAPVDFGSSFGISSLSYSSRTANAAGTGILRLANLSDSISWRNAANSADLPLTVNASNQLSFNGTPIGGSGIFAANRAIVSDGSGNLSVATTTSTEIGYVNGVTSAIQTQLNAKKTISTGNAYKFETTDASGNLQETTVTASRAVATDANGLPTASATTATELGYVSGVTSAIQTQINSKAPTASPTFTGTITTPLTASRALTTGASSELAVSATTATELGYVSGVTSAIQTQLDGKLTAAGGTITGDITFSSGKGIFFTDSGTNTVKITAPTTITSTYALKWPVAQGASNQYLTNDGSGNLSWTNAAGTGTVNSGTQYQMAYYAASSNAVSGSSTITTDASGNFIATGNATVGPGGTGTTNALLKIDGGSGAATGSQLRFLRNSVLAATIGTYSSVFGSGNATDLAIFSASSNIILNTASVDVLTITTAQQAAFAAGTLAVPTITLGDSTTGWYRQAANRWSFATGGSEIVRLTSTGLQLSSGVLSVGDGSAAAPTHTFFNDPDTGMFQNGANNIGFSVGGVEKMNIAAGAIALETAQVRFESGSAASPSISFTGDITTGIYRIGASNIGVSLGGAQYLNIGTTNFDATSNIRARVATVGGTTLLQAFNSDNTNAASHASAQFITGGTSAGDPFVFFQVNGTNGMALGVDNSDSDALVISQTSTLGTTNAIRINSATSAVAIRGTDTNDSAAAGFVGQVVSSAVSTTNFPTSTQYGDLTSISLTAGDWLVSANASAIGGGATVTVINFGISTTSGNSSTGLVNGDNLLGNAQTRTTVTGVFENFSIVSYRISLAATTTVYFKYNATYSVATPAAAGRITAVRIR